MSPVTYITRPMEFLSGLFETLKRRPLHPSQLAPRLSQRQRRKARRRAAAAGHRKAHH